MNFNRLIEFIKNKWEFFLGWIDIILKPGFDLNYTYVMKMIEVKEKQGRMFSIVHYKLIGCRKLLSETAIELNRLTLFSLFRPDHAQIIVSIATIETIMSKSSNEIYEKYRSYVDFCNKKLDGRN